MIDGAKPGAGSDDNRKRQTALACKVQKIEPRFAAVERHKKAASALNNQRRAELSHTKYNRLKLNGLEFKLGRAMRRQRLLKGQESICNMFL